MFDATSIIYLYICIIISTILFDLWYTFYDRLSAKKSKKKTKQYKEKIVEEINKKKMKKEEKHLKYFTKKLRRVNNLLAYQSALDELKEEEGKEKIDHYLTIYGILFQNLVVHYRKKNSIYKAFLASFLTKHYPFRLSWNRYIDDEMMNYVSDKSIYCRENAMLYFYQRGSSDLVVQALKKLNRNNLYYNKKQFANDLLKFRGNHEELDHALMKDFSNFSVAIQIGIVNYFRFSNNDFRKKIYEMLKSSHYDKEVDLAFIRYLGKNVYMEALPLLLSFLQMDDEKNIEYKIITAQVIFSYDVEQVRKALIFCLSDNNWYIRKNAAESLFKMKRSEEDDEMLLNLEDRYAKEMVEYVFVSKRKKQIKKKDGSSYVSVN